jgi:SAM-dependent methyltransferase
VTSTACPACNGTRIAPFLELGNVPVFCNVQWPSREQALAADKGPLVLWACPDCSHVFNRAFDARRVAYAPGYENSQHASSVFRDYANRLVDRLMDRHAMHGKPVVDIGCGRGDLLALFCERGGSRGFGFDPSYAGKAGADGSGPFTVRREYYSPEHAATIRPALVSCRHVLEHIEHPVAFLRSLRSTLQAGGAGAVLYLEVPSGEELLSALGLWDYLYEHVSYFSEASLRAVLAAAGFEVMVVQRDFGGQFLCAEARVAEDAAPAIPAAAKDQGDELRRAAAAMQERLAQWRSWAAAMPADGSVSIWGAGSKGVMFLNLLGLPAQGAIERIVDQNADKHGRFVSGTGQEIVGPEALRGSGVREIVLMNGIYEGEIRARLSAMDVNAKLTIAWPQGQ